MDDSLYAPNESLLQRSLRLARDHQVVVLTLASLLQVAAAVHSSGMRNLQVPLCLLSGVDKKGLFFVSFDQFWMHIFAFLAENSHHEGWPRKSE